MGKDTIILHLDWNVFLKRLSNEQLGEWTRAVMQYMETEQEPQGLDPAVDVAFYAAFERIGRDQDAWNRKMSGLKQYRDKKEGTDRKAPYGVRTGSVPVPVPVPVPEPVLSSSDDNSTGDAGTTMIPTDLMEKMEQAFGKPTAYTQGRLQKVFAQMSPELAAEILETCLQNNAESFSYFLTAANKAIEQGVTTVEAYRAGHTKSTSGHNVRVDRAQPSGNDWITAAVDRAKKENRVREILFRGKQVDNGEWAYGYYVHECGNLDETAKDWIEGCPAGLYEVTPETIGQYTGRQERKKDF